MNEFQAKSSPSKIEGGGGSMKILNKMLTLPH